VLPVLNQAGFFYKFILGLNNAKLSRFEIQAEKRHFHFSVVGQLAAEYKAINLWQGAPGFTPDQHLVESAFQAVREGFNLYGPMPGVLPLREALARKTAKLYGAQYDPNTEITVTAGGLEAVYATITALVHAGDEVIYFDPAFECYEPTVRLQGATPVPIKIPLDTMKIDWDQVQAAITPRTRMIIVNTPHNPTGSVLDQNDIERLIAVTRGTDIVILSDEVYEHIGLRWKDASEHGPLSRTG